MTVGCPEHSSHSMFAWLTNSSACLFPACFLFDSQQDSLRSAAGVIPASESGGKMESDMNDKASSSGISLGSDALALPWYTGQGSLDMPLCCNLTCMALAVLHRMKRYHTVVQVICSKLMLHDSMHQRFTV